MPSAWDFLENSYLDKKDRMVNFTGINLATHLMLPRAISEPAGPSSTPVMDLLIGDFMLDENTGCFNNGLDLDAVDYSPLIPSYPV
jgi:hypothetical protein